MGEEPGSVPDPATNEPATHTPKHGGRGAVGGGSGIDQNQPVSSRGQFQGGGVSHSPTAGRKKTPLFPQVSCCT